MPVLVVFAPTACGKTGLALELFGRDADSPFAGLAELISADSMQVYRGMDIGTAKPTAHERAQLPHHLIDIHSPREPFSAGEFVRLGDRLCQEIYGRRHLPLILGGTGFYIRNFLCGLPPTPQADPALRNSLRRQLQEKGAAVLHAQLAELDSVSAARIHPNDHYRLLRSLEVCLASGRPQSSFNPSPRLREGYNFCVIILTRDRQELYRRIEERVARMMEEGLPDEVAALMAAGYTAQDPGMQAIGYQEFFPQNETSVSGQPPSRWSREELAAIQEAICRNSRRYAKRQYTYFRGIPQAQYFHAEDKEGIASCVRNFLQSSAFLLT